MNEFCLALLTNLLRTTAYLSTAAVLIGILLKISRCQSPRVHRVAWCLVLLQGLLFVRIPWSVAWLSRPVPAANRTENLPRLDEPLILPIDPLAKFSAPPNDEAISVAPRTVAPEQPSQPSAIARLRNHWPILAALFWLGGVVTVAGVWIFRYVRFLRTVPAGEQGDAQWQQEFASVLGETNRASAIDLRIADDTGPLICRRHGRYILLVPRPLWASLSSAQRQSILRHEIGHYRRSDLWKSVVIRVLALPHWFNPFAWWAVSHFDEAAEWACDQMAAGDAVSATDFANTLLKICESTNSYGVMISAARGSSVKRRIGRLLSLSKEDSIMRKIMVCATAGLLLIAGGVRIRLVADDAPATSPNPEPAAATSAIASEISFEAKAMVQAAEKAYEASVAAYEAGTVGLEQVYTWSRRWLQAAADLAEIPGERGLAYRNHRDRMQQLFDDIQAKYVVGAKGGEADRFAAAQFYLAEAKLWVNREVNNLPIATAKPAILPEANAALQVEIYPIHNADSDLVVKVLQTALAVTPDVRLAIDAKTNSIVAQARPSVQAKIRELVNKLDVKPREIVKPDAIVAPQSKRVVYEVKSPEELIKILQPLLAGQQHVEMKSMANNSQLIVSAPAEQQEAICALVEKLNKENLANQTPPDRREAPPR